LASLTNTGTTADVIYTLPAAADAVFLEDDGSPDNGMLQLRSTSGAFDTTVFANPVGSLTIKCGNASDTLQVSSLPDFNAALTIGLLGNPFSTITIGGGITLAADKNLSATASSGINLPNATSSIDVQGSGTVILQGNASLLAGASLSSEAGAITIDNRFEDHPGNSVGIHVSGATIQSSSGNITLQAYGGNSGNENDGIVIDSAASISTGGQGQVQISGQGGSSTSGSGNDGVQISGGAHVETTGTGELFIGGGGGATNQEANSGIIVRDVGTLIHTSAGYLVVIGTAGGSLLGTTCGGLLLSDGAAITSDAGVVDISAYGGSDTYAYGLHMFGPSAPMISSSSDISIRGISGTAGNLGLQLDDGATISSSTSEQAGHWIYLTADHMAVANTATISVPFGVLQIRATNGGEGIDLGSTSDSATNMLEISDAELDRMTAEAFVIGSRIGGPLLVSSDITRASPTFFNLYGYGTMCFVGGSITTPGGFVELYAGEATTISAPKAGLDVNVGPTALFSIPEGGTVEIAINGTAVDSQYDQINVVGNVSLRSADLALTGNYTPAVGDRFTIINNTLPDATTNQEFNGLPEGQVFSAVLGGKTVEFQITYKGGDGNDVVLTAVNTAPSFVIGPDESSTDESPAQSIPGWATGISAGLPNESGQKLTFYLTADQSQLFKVQPRVDPLTGTLTFTPKPNARGTAVISVVLKDDGGTANGGTDISPRQKFKINITKPHLWHNVANPYQIIPGDITPKGLLVLISYLNAYGASEVPPLGTFINGQPVDSGKPFGYLDVNGDNIVAPNDLLPIISFLNQFGAGEGESPQATPTSTTSASDALFNLLAGDTASQQKRRL
jgi:hypothetical protein